MVSEGLHLKNTIVVDRKDYIETGRYRGSKTAASAATDHMTIRKEANLRSVFASAAGPKCKFKKPVSVTMGTPGSGPGTLRSFSVPEGNHHEASWIEGGEASPERQRKIRY